MSILSIKMPDSIHGLIAQLADADQEVRLCAALNIGSMEGNASAAVPALLNMLESDTPIERRVAAMALGDIAATEAISALLAHSRDHDSGVREFVAEAIQKISSVTSLAA
jgi:HEAT repeat protein